MTKKRQKKKKNSRRTCFFSFDCTNFLIEKHKKNNRNEYNVLKIVISVLKIGLILAFTIIYSLNISLKMFWAHWEKMVLVGLSLLLAPKYLCIYLRYLVLLLYLAYVVKERDEHQFSKKEHGKGSCSICFLVLPCK